MEDNEVVDDQNSGWFQVKKVFIFYFFILFLTLLMYSIKTWHFDLYLMKDKIEHTPRKNVELI